MPHILSIFKEEGFECLPCERVNLDVERFTEYRDSGEHPAETAFENPSSVSGILPVSQLPPDVPTILHYFLDGSRRTYKIADVVLNGKYLPVIAGQVGVAVVRRSADSSRLEPMRQFCRLETVVALPDSVGPSDVSHLEKAVRQKTGRSICVLTYQIKLEREPVDLGVARIMRMMQDLEVEAVTQMSAANLLHNEALLVIDGPLRFKKMSGRSFDIVQFRNVIGLSKSFRPSFTVGKGRAQRNVGTITAGLRFSERTSAYRTSEDGEIIGMWYLRIRQPNMMNDPLQGIVKVECFAVSPEEKELGLDADRIEAISAHLLRERNATAYGVDPRWPSHIYPIHSAEIYLKTSFMSDLHFQALF